MDHTTIAALAGFENQILELIYDAEEGQIIETTSDLQGRIGAIVLGAYQLGKSSC